MGLPIARTNGDLLVVYGQTVTLSAANSDPNGSPITGWNWNQTEGTNSISFSPDRFQEEVSFIAPSSDDVIKVRLLVTNADGESERPANQFITVVESITNSGNPEITLNGPSTLVVDVNEAFNDPGCVAIDSLGSTIDCTITGSVDINTIGTYQLSYDATDVDGNVAETVTRIVIVQAASSIKPAPSGIYDSYKTITPSSTPEEEHTVANNFVDGRLLRFNTSDIYPEQDKFDFRIIDEQIAIMDQYNKPFSLAIGDAKSLPQWIKDGAATIFSYPFRDGTETTVLPWDAFYQQEKQKLINALATAYDKHPNLRAIYFTYPAMTNGMEGHWRVSETDYAAAGYTYNTHLTASQTILDFYMNAFTKTTVLMETHVFFEAITFYTDLYNYGFGQIGSRCGLGFWWLASRIAEGDDNNSDQLSWGLGITAKANGSPIVGQSIASFTLEPERFDYVDPPTGPTNWTTAEALVYEYNYFYNDNPDSTYINATEYWPADLKNEETINLITSLVDGDFTPPVLKLKGSATVTIEAGENYVELGATATDAIDGDISSNVVITGTINNAIEGQYTLAYDVTDLSGNAAETIYRTINVVRPSYASVEFVNSYHSVRKNEAWKGSEAVKRAAIAKATDYIETKYADRFIGIPATESQTLHFPALDAYDAYGRLLSSTEVPVAVQNAVAELAIVALVQPLHANILPTSNPNPIQQKQSGIGPLRQLKTYATNRRNKGPSYPIAHRYLKPVLKSRSRRVIRN